jgi:hypothetical protein
VWLRGGEIGFVDGRIGRGDEGEVVGHDEEVEGGFRTKVVMCRTKCRMYEAAIDTHFDCQIVCASVGSVGSVGSVETVSAIQLCK